MLPVGLIYRRLDGGEQEHPPAVNTLRVRESGPLAVRADLRLAGQPDAIRATLCRCGASQNKPYCDGSHTAAGFAASGEPATQPSEPLAQRGGPLRVTPVKDGPLQVEGNLELCSGTGRTLNRIEKTAVPLRGSQNKPYCDGTHKQVGFRSEPGPA
jgi:CDGSH-type Zn-finger protein